MRRILRDSALLIGACNGYHLITLTGRLVGLQALRDAIGFDPEDFAQLWAEVEAETASGPTTNRRQDATRL